MARDNGADVRDDRIKSFVACDVIAEAIDAEGNTTYLAVEAAHIGDLHDADRVRSHAALMQRLTNKPCRAVVASTRNNDRLAELIDSGEVAWHQLKPWFEIENIDEIKIGCKDGVLHLARLRPSAPGAEEETVADGNVETVLSISQILRGKLRRGLTSPVRDVFDVVSGLASDASREVVFVVPRQVAEAQVSRQGDVGPHDIWPRGQISCVLTSRPAFVCRRSPGLRA